MKRRTVTKMRKLFAEVVVEVQANEAFAERLEAVLGYDTPPPARRRGRRKPGVLNPYQVLEESGREGLRAELRKLDVERLKDIVAEHGMDPAKLAMKWKKSDRLVAHIEAFVTARDRKGDAFRAKEGGGSVARDLEKEKGTGDRDVGQV